ncbi:hypothetical protein [Leptothoe spongobia]|uniref:Uncharacterized protein n=1 Tax=Leptothoe spongobia TAU-MAC 1115 TaxID=1967444 RepID=A0A947DDT2_9CYAN|nr:hypothetical protein [Leptothoe spongobia]MBT9315075.1 hypothetical protein [Leptothoe spongobia TAU-MAC 1115]
MSILWIIIAIALLLCFIWQLMQPKQGAKASNAPSPTPPDALPSGEAHEESNAVAAVFPEKAPSPSPPQNDPSPAPNQYLEAETPPMPRTQVSYEATPALRQAVIRLLAEHQKATAVKLVREETHWRLHQAKEYVDALQGALHILQAEVNHFLDIHQKSAAITRVSTVTGWDLSKSMDYVEHLQRNLS